VKGRLNHLFYSREFSAFLFEFKEDRDLIFCNNLYFLGARGMYLNIWTPNFNPENGIPTVVPIRVRLSHLPLRCWSDDSLRCVGNLLGCYLDRVELKENIFSCA
jgi:hypothetical protein